MLATMKAACGYRIMGLFNQHQLVLSSKSKCCITEGRGPLDAHKHPQTSTSNTPHTDAEGTQDALLPAHHHH